MPILTQCPECMETQNVPDLSLGKFTRCVTCRNSFPVKRYEPKQSENPWREPELPDVIDYSPPVGVAAKPSPAKPPTKTPPATDAPEQLSRSLNNLEDWTNRGYSFALYMTFLSAVVGCIHLLREYSHSGPEFFKALFWVPLAAIGARWQIGADSSCRRRSSSPRSTQVVC